MRAMGPRSIRAKPPCAAHTRRGCASSFPNCSVPGLSTPTRGRHMGAEPLAQSAYVSALSEGERSEQQRPDEGTEAEVGPDGLDDLIGQSDVSEGTPPLRRALPGSDRLTRRRAPEGLNERARMRCLIGGDLRLVAFPNWRDETDGLLIGSAFRARFERWRLQRRSGARTRLAALADINDKHRHLAAATLAAIAKRGSVSG
jgi:hypothetical protein